MTQIPYEIVLEDWKDYDGNRREKLSVKAYRTSTKSKWSTAGVKPEKPLGRSRTVFKRSRGYCGKVSIIKMYKSLGLINTKCTDTYDVCMCILISLDKEMINKFR